MADNDVSCCTPRHARATPTPTPTVQRRTLGHAIEQCLISAGVFAMGDATGDGRAGDGETPVHQVALDGFRIEGLKGAIEANLPA